MKLSNIKPLGQKDKKWASKKLGFGTGTIGDYGCVLTCCTMLCNYYSHNTAPDKLNEDMKKVGGYYNKNLWQWHKLTEIYPDIKFTGGLDFPNDPTPLNKIDKQLNKGFPVIAYIDYSSKPGIQTHFVLIVGKVNGDYLINDPLGGETYFFKAKYGDIVKRVLGLRFYEGKVPNAPQTGSNELAECLKAHQSLMRQLEAKGKELERFKHRLQVSETVRKSLGSTIKQLNAENSRILERKADWQSKLESAKSSLKNCEGRKKNLRQEILDLKKEKQDNKRRYENLLKRDVSKIPVKKLLVYLVKKVLRIKNV